ncbi:MAG: cytochrome C oxidase subunit IV family protein [Acidobacteriota bacterium]
MADVHVSNPSVYLRVLGVLAFLTVLTVNVAYYDFGALNDFIALSIAITKASFVIWFFMHVNHAGRLVKLTVGAGIVWLIIMFGMMIIDYVSRNDVVDEPIPITEPLPSNL